MYVLTQVWRPCRDVNVIFHVWLKQTIRIFLPCKFTAECTNKRSRHFPEPELRFGLSNGLSSSSVSVRHFPCRAFSSLWSFLVPSFQVLQIQRPPSTCRRPSQNNFISFLCLYVLVMKCRESYIGGSVGCRNGPSTYLIFTVIHAVDRFS